MPTSRRGGDRPGKISMWGHLAVEPGYLRCDGTIYNIAQYPRLAAKLGNVHGGDGITTFGVPEIRGEGVRGLDEGRGVDVGRTLGSAQAHALQDFRLSTTNAAGVPGATVSDVYTAQVGAIYNANAQGAPGDSIIAVRPPSGGFTAVIPVNCNVAAETRMRNAAFPFRIKT